MEIYLENTNYYTEPPLTVLQVQQMFWLRLMWKWKPRDLSKMFNISNERVRAIFREHNEPICQTTTQEEKDARILARNESYKCKKYPKPKSYKDYLKDAHIDLVTYLKNREIC